MQSEKECMDIERSWKAKCSAMEKVCACVEYFIIIFHFHLNHSLISFQEVEEWKKKCHQQELKADRLREHLSRTERELYGLLQRKYQIMRGPSGTVPKMPQNSRLGSGVDMEKREEAANEDVMLSQHVSYVFNC